LAKSTSSPAPTVSEIDADDPDSVVVVDVRNGPKPTKINGAVEFPEAEIVGRMYELPNLPSRRRSVREQHWRGIFSGWKASGLSISAFCRNRDIAEASFYYWRREAVVTATSLNELESRSRQEYGLRPIHCT
jgi:hypothetical protein